MFAGDDKVGSPADVELTLVWWGFLDNSLQQLSFVCALRAEPPSIFVVCLARWPSSLLARWPIAELPSSINIPLTMALN